jgi:hypothetical protein
MALNVFANNATLVTTSTSGTTAPVSGTTETWSVASLSSLWPALATGQQLRIQDATGGASTNQQSEIILVTSCGGAGTTSIGVTRGVEGTTPVAHASGSIFINTVTAACLNNFEPLAQSIKTVTGSGTTLTLVDCSVATMHNVVLNNNCTLTFPTPLAGASITLILTQDSTGSRLVTWPSNVFFPSHVAPTLSTGANKVDIFKFLCYDGTNWCQAPGLDLR